MSSSSASGRHRATAGATPRGTRTRRRAPRRASRPLGARSESEDTLRRTLVLAQRTADAAIAEANAEAAAAGQRHARAPRPNERSSHDQRGKRARVAKLLSDAEAQAAFLRTETEAELRRMAEERREPLMDELRQLERTRSFLQDDVATARASRVRATSTSAFADRRTRASVGGSRAAARRISAVHERRRGRAPGTVVTARSHVTARGVGVCTPATASFGVGVPPATRADRDVRRYRRRLRSPRRPRRAHHCLRAHRLAGRASVLGIGSIVGR